MDLIQNYYIQCTTVKTIAGWVTYIKKVGDKIQENDEIAKVDTEFYVVTILAPCEGVLDEVYVPDGYKVKSHQGMFRVRHRVIEEDDTITETPRRVYPNKDQVQKTVEKTIEKTSPRCYQDENVSAPEYVNSICPKTYHNYTEPGDIYKGKSQKLKNRYEID